MDKKLISFFEKNQISFEKFDHPAVFTVAESYKIKSSIPGLATKNLFLKGKNSFYLVCLRGTKRLNLKQLKEHTKTNDLHFASAEELFSELKVLPGSVSLFAMIYAKNTKLILDKELWESDLVGFHPNENTSTLVISHEMLVKFCSLLKIKPEIIDLKE